ncbi:MAG TPA: hypothetical protein VGL99_12400, partial [Chloroflexota bacterium]
MATSAPPPEPSSRLPWVLVGLVGLLIVVGILAFLFTRPRDVTLNIEGTPTALARAASPGVPPTLAVPTLPPSQPTTTPQPASAPAATKPAAATPTVVAQAPAKAAPTPPQGTQPTPEAKPPTQPAPSPAPPAPPSPTTVGAQVASPGGFANTRTDLDAALGPPVGETPQHLVAYRKNNVEYHVEFVPDPSGRAALIVEIPPTNPPLTIDMAMTEARKLLPRDAQPPSPPAEGNNQFVVQRFTSQSLIDALGPEPFDARQTPPGQIMVVYARDPAQNTRIARIVVGIGT